MMVIKSSTAKTKCIQAVYKPPVTIQIILNKRERQPPEEDAVTTFFPNGNNVNKPILKHRIPNGIPMIVMQKTKPITKYPRAETKPPKINQIILPIIFMN